MSNVILLPCQENMGIDLFNTQLVITDDGITPIRTSDLFNTLQWLSTLSQEGPWPKNHNLYFVTFVHWLKQQPKLLLK